MADPSDLPVALLPSFVLSKLSMSFVNMGVKQHCQIEGISAKERCRVSRKNDYPDNKKFLI